MIKQYKKKILNFKKKIKSHKWTGILKMNRWF